MGFQTGLYWKDIYMYNDHFHLEYTWTDHRIYHHRFKVNDAYSWGYPVGFWAGPHAEEIYADYSFSLGGSHIQIMISFAKRGEFTDSMRVNQYSEQPSNIPVYKRFEFDNSENCGDCIGIVETKQLIRLSVKRNLNEKMEIYVQYSYVHWDNAGFDPSSQYAQNIHHMGKHSLGFGIHYRY